MKSRGGWILVWIAAFAATAIGQDAALTPPGIGKPEILRIGDVKPGMTGVAWTVLEGTTPEAIPIEIVGVYKNAAGPRQDIILGKMGGKALRTNVAGGMSGSPVYVGGKLVGAISTRISVLSPDTICGITPIELMLEVPDFDGPRPPSAGAPAQTSSGGLAAPVLTPIETPLTFAGFQPQVLREVAPLFRQFGLTPVQGGATAALRGSRPVDGWQDSLKPGEMVAAVLVSGDLAVTGMGTVTYNDGEKVLAFGHSLLNMGRVSMPMSRGEVLMTLASSLQPNKLANATAIVGALRQDRHSGVMGVLGAQADMMPVRVAVRSVADDGSVRREQTFHYDVCLLDKLTPALLLSTLYNTIAEVNDFGEETTYRLRGTLELEGGRRLSLATMQAPSELPSPAPLLLANWFADRFNRLFTNAVTAPRFRSVDLSVDLISERRSATVESAWMSSHEVQPGDRVQVKVFLRPYRGPRLEREFSWTVPANLPKGEHRLLLSDADTLNRTQTAAGRANRFLELDRSISLISQERANNQLYVSVVTAGSTAYYDDKVLPSLPPSALNVMQAGPAAGRAFLTSRETTVEQAAIPFDYVISGSHTLSFTVK